jgi:hypothetical protein
MGAVYNTEFTIKTKEGTEDKIFDRLNQFIEAEDSNSVEFKIPKIKANGNNMETYLDLLKLFFSTCSKPAKDITVESNGCLSYNNDFCATYGWLGVIENVIHMIAEYLEDYSYFYIEADSACELYVVKNGSITEYEPSFDNIEKLSRTLSITYGSEVKSDDDLIVTKLDKDYDNTHILQEGELIKEND